MSAFCQRFPNNANCVQTSASSSSSSVSSSVSTSSNNRPVDPTSLGLPPPPGSSQPAPSSNTDPCGGWMPVYNKFCTTGTIQADYQASCSQYAQSCLSGGGGGRGGGGAGAGAGSGMQSGGPVNPNAVGLPPPPTQGMGMGGAPQPQQIQPQPQAQGSGFGSTWSALTQKAQADQAQALTNAQNGAPNCGQYQQNYNVWCGGAQPINPVYCNTLGRMCSQQMQQQASGQSTFGGPFANNGGLPTGGAGSTRPLTVGQNFGVGPFFGMDKTLGINPLQGVGQRQAFNVPIAGIGVQSSKGVDWGGLPGVAQLGAALGRRRRRWAIPVAVDNFGNVIYMIH